MPVIRQELHLTKEQVGNSIIASVAITVVARLLIGWLCDRMGPRRTYAWMLILGSLPVMGVGLAHDYLTFLIFRLAIGAIGAGFVITQFHTSLMFAPRVVGTANGAAAGWGNLGGGVTQMVMPLLFTWGRGGAGGWPCWFRVLRSSSPETRTTCSPRTRLMATSANFELPARWPTVPPLRAHSGGPAGIHARGLWLSCTDPVSAWS
jgi:nitrate/nitrite transporter NarK